MPSRITAKRQGTRIEALHRKAMVGAALLVGGTLVVNAAPAAAGWPFALPGNTNRAVAAKPAGQTVATDRPAVSQAAAVPQAAAVSQAAAVPQPAAVSQPGTTPRSEDAAGQNRAAHTPLAAVPPEVETQQPAVASSSSSISSRLGGLRRFVPFGGTESGPSAAQTASPPATKVANHDNLSRREMNPLQRLIRTGSTEAPPAAIAGTYSTQTPRSADAAAAAASAIGADSPASAASKMPVSAVAASRTANGQSRSLFGGPLELPKALGGREDPVQDPFLEQRNQFAAKPVAAPNQSVTGSARPAAPTNSGLVAATGERGTVRQTSSTQPAVATLNPSSASDTARTPAATSNRFEPQFVTSGTAKADGRPAPADLFQPFGIRGTNSAPGTASAITQTSTAPLGEANPFTQFERDLISQNKACTANTEVQAGAERTLPQDQIGLSHHVFTKAQPNNAPQFPLSQTLAATASPAAPATPASTAASTAAAAAAATRLPWEIDPPVSPVASQVAQAEFATEVQALGERSQQQLQGTVPAVNAQATAPAAPLIAFVPAARPKPTFTPVIGVPTPSFAQQTAEPTVPDRPFERTAMLTAGSTTDVTDQHSAEFASFGVSAQGNGPKLCPDQPTAEMSAPVAAAGPTIAGSAAEHLSPEIAVTKLCSNIQSTASLAEPLKGLCPVTLRDDRRPVVPHPQYSCNFEGCRYEFVSAKAMARFQNDPGFYAPAASGRDVVLVSAGDTEATGNLKYASIYHSRLYLFQSEVTQRAFVANPSRFGVLEK